MIYNDNGNPISLLSSMSNKYNVAAKAAKPLAPGKNRPVVTIIIVYEKSMEYVKDIVYLNLIKKIQFKFMF